MSATSERSVITNLGESGSRLWREFNPDNALGEDDRVVLLEACRLADRCDRLELLLAGDVGTWASVDFSHGTLSLLVDRALVEARQHAVALARLVRQLRVAASGAQGGVVGAGEVPNGVISLTERVARKRASSAG